MEKLKTNSSESYGVLITGFKSPEEVWKWMSAYINSIEQHMGECLDDGTPSYSGTWPDKFFSIEREGNTDIQVRELELERYDEDFD